MSNDSAGRESGGVEQDLREAKLQCGHCPAEWFPSDGPWPADQHGDGCAFAELLEAAEYMLMAGADCDWSVDDPVPMLDEEAENKLRLAISKAKGKSQ